MFLGYTYAVKYWNQHVIEQLVVSLFSGFVTFDDIKVQGINSYGQHFFQPRFYVGQYLVLPLG